MCVVSKHPNPHRDAASEHAEEVVANWRQQKTAQSTFAACAARVAQCRITISLNILYTPGSAIER